MASSFRFARAMEAEILWPFLWIKIVANSAVPIPRGTRPNQYYILVGGGTPTKGKNEISPLGDSVEMTES